MLPLGLVDDVGMYTLWHFAVVVVGVGGKGGCYGGKGRSLG